MKLDITKLVKVRKPTNDEQRCGKIVTSDYGISGVTIHSSVLKTLGWIDKVYRRKETIVSYGNKAEIKSAKKLLNSFAKSVTPYSLVKLVNDANEHCEFVDYIELEMFTSWMDVKDSIPNFIIENNYRTPLNFFNSLSKARNFVALFNCDGILEGLSELKFEKSKSVKSLIPTFEAYFDKIESDTVTKHTQTVIWEKAYNHQLMLEEELGKDFTPQQFSTILDKNTLDIIKNEWYIDLTTYEGSWSDLCDYLYSPKLIKEIRDRLGVKVRARESNTVRKGVESSENKQFTKIISKKRAICGNDFDLTSEQRKIKESERELLMKETDYEEAKFVLNHAIENGSD